MYDFGVKNISVIMVYAFDFWCIDCIHFTYLELSEIQIIGNCPAFTFSLLFSSAKKTNIFIVSELPYTIYICDCKTTALSVDQMYMYLYIVDNMYVNI